MNRIAFLKTFIEKDPADLFSRHALAMELVKEGNDNEARQIMEDILVFDELYVGTYYHLGKLHERNADLLKARGVYVKGIEVAERLNELNSLRELKAALQQVNEELES
ncbi:MAG: hypothetical protein ACK5AO_06115 [bacterium]